jgi:regulator of sirC expression with transglutaminase-like and TPR domain
LSDSVVELQRAFTRTALCPDDQIDLARTALLIARLAYPDLDESFYLQLLEGMAARLRGRITNERGMHRIAEEMSRLLFQEEGFVGNSAFYYDPDNSYLNRVLDRKKGIPITLSLVHMEVGRRAGLTVRGIGLPGHFITALYGDEGRILVDPFNGGVVLDENDCRRRIALQYGGSKVFGTHLLDPVGPKKIIVRLLRNLKGIYRQVGEMMKGFQVVEWIIALDPNAAIEYRERGLLYKSLGAFDFAVRDLQKYLSLLPDAEDAEDVQSEIERLEGETPLFH